MDESTIDERVATGLTERDCADGTRSATDRERAGPLDIGVLSFEYPPSRSGLPRAAREIAQALAGAGQRVRVLTLDRSGREWDGEVEVIGCRLDSRRTAARLRRLAGVGHLIAPAAFRRRVVAEHRRRPFDLIEASNWYAPGAAVASFGPVPLITRNSTPAVAGRAGRRGLRAHLDGYVVDWLERHSARASAALISNTEAHRDRIADTYALGAGTPHRAIAPPVDPDVLVRGADAEYPGDDTPLRLLFVGRPDRRKGFDALIAAIERLGRMEDLPAFALHLVGVEGATLPVMPARGSHATVRALGRLDDAGLHAEYRAAHAVLAPSRAESFGYVYQEALAFGRPIVACAEDASARRFVGEPGAGLLVEHCTGEELATAIRRVLTEPALRARLHRRARRAAGRCTREGCATATLALYRRVLRVTR